MKKSPFAYIGITTFILITVTIMCGLDLPFNWVFYLTVIGQLFVVLMVYNVLRDNYTTDKTFEHFYEDCPVRPIEVKVENEKLR